MTESGESSSERSRAGRMCGCMIAIIKQKREKKRILLKNVIPIITISYFCVRSAVAP